MAAEINGHAHQADICDLALEGIIEDIAAAGPIHALVNCAGIARSARIVSREGPMPLAAFEEVVRVNLVGTFNLMRLVTAKMTLQEPLETGERGVIVNTASAAAFDGQIGQAAYSASKGGVVAMALPAARELARFGVRVNTIAPGLFKTPLLAQLPEEAQAAIAASIPFPARMGAPEEFAQTVQYIIETPYINAEVIRLDGAVRLAPK